MANLFGSSGYDYLTGTEYNDRMYGKGGDDELYGEFGNDKLYGDRGGDYLVGGYGNDVLTGGSGADTFVFNDLYEGIDTIKDFKWSQGDTIQIDSYGFEASSTDEFYYDSGSGALYHYDEQFATLQPNLNFDVSTDIILI